jgi:hypothetical protein
MKQDNKLEREKRIYEKPKLTTIELVVDEVLFFGCKLADSGYAFGQNPCTLGNCSQEGS